MSISKRIYFFYYMSLITIIFLLPSSISIWDKCGIRPQYNDSFHSQSKLSYGVPCATRGEYPWNGIVYARNNTVFCGIILISPSYAVGSYLCTGWIEPRVELFATFGTVDSNVTTNDTYEVSNNYLGDYQLIFYEFNPSVRLSPYVQPICIANNDSIFINSSAVVTGWIEPFVDLECNNRNLIINDPVKNNYTNSGLMYSPLIFDQTSVMFTSNCQKTGVKKEGKSLKKRQNSPPFLGAYLNIEGDGSYLQAMNEFGVWYLLGSNLRMCGQYNHGRLNLYNPLTIFCDYIKNITNSTVECVDPNINPNASFSTSTTVLLSSVTDTPSKLSSLTTTQIISTTISNQNQENNTNTTVQTSSVTATISTKEWSKTTLPMTTSFQGNNTSTTVQTSSITATISTKELSKTTLQTLPITTSFDNQGNNTNSTERVNSITITSSKIEWTKTTQILPTTYKDKKTIIFILVGLFTMMLSVLIIILAYVYTKRKQHITIVVGEQLELNNLSSNSS